MFLLRLVLSKPVGIISINAFLSYLDQRIKLKMSFNGLV